MNKFCISLRDSKISTPNVHVLLTWLFSLREIFVKSLLSVPGRLFLLGEIIFSINAVLVSYREISRSIHYCEKWQKLLSHKYLQVYSISYEKRYR